MQVTTLALDSFNMLSVGTRRYFLLQQENVVLIAPSECPHRGGPMHLAKHSTCRARLVCPWHENSYSKHRITRDALPAIQNRQEISIVTNSPDVHAWKEHLLINHHAECIQEINTTDTGEIR